MNLAGYGLLGRIDTKNAILVFKFHVMLFPRSGNVYASLGEVHEKVGITNLAIENYTKSYTRDPDNNHATERLAPVLIRLSNRFCGLNGSRSQPSSARRKFAVKGGPCLTAKTPALGRG